MDKFVAAHDGLADVAESSSDAPAGVGRRLCHRNRKKSLLAHLFVKPLSLAVLCSAGIRAVVVLGYAAAWIIPGLQDSAEQRTLHRAAVHTDHTTLNTHVVRAFPSPKTLVYRDRDGGLHRALVDQTDLDRFVNETLNYLDAERTRISPARNSCAT